MAGFDFVLVAYQGLEHIVRGFSNTNANEMAFGMELVALSMLILPVAKKFFNEAKISRKEKRELKKKSRSQRF